MKEAHVETTNNGFIVILKDGASSLQYVYRSVDDMEMVQKVGEYLTERKLSVKDRWVTHKHTTEEDYNDTRRAG